MFDNRHHGALHISVWLPAPPGVQASLVGEAPSKYFVPPYVGHQGWVGVVLDERPEWKLVDSMVKAAHAYVVAKSKRRK